VASAPGLLLGESAFNSNPMNDPQWAAALSAQNAKPLPPTMPVLVTQSTNDGIVLADSIGAMQEQWCAAGSTLQVDWLGPLTEPWSSQSILSHLLEGEVGGPLATSWFYQRFAGAAPVSNCNTPPLVLPAAPAG
jgi:hypothetical protein